VGIFDFVKDAGERLFGGEDEGETRVVRTPDMARADKARGESLTKLVGSMGLGVEDLNVKFRDGVATVQGSAPSQGDKEKAILLIGNTQGVARVDDQIQVAEPEPEARMYTVVSGDSLSKISKELYGDAMKYMKIFEANQPMLKDPNKIYPGQVLRIPPLD
jgi:nucleoid-associated protein YgaU